jgi:protein TonB
MTSSPKRSALLSALIHAAVIVVILILTSVKHPLIDVLPPLRDIPVYLPARPHVSSSGGGGGARSRAQANKGELPKPAPRVFVAPTVEIQNTRPHLPMAPTILASEVKVPTFDFSQLGDPNGVSGPLSNGTGRNGGIGNGDHGGVGDHQGPGYGPGEMPGISETGAITGKGVTRPIKISGSEPEYSEEARKAKLQGTVMLQIVVDSEGRPQNIKVVKSLGLGLDERAIETVRTWRFRPGTSNGKPVPTLAVIEVYFRLL